MRRIVGLVGWAALTVAIGVGWAARPALAATLDQVIAQGTVRCGVSASAAPGFATRDETGSWAGFDVDYCRAIAAAVLGDAEAIRVVALRPEARATAVASGRVDVLAADVPWTLRLDAAGVTFAAVTFFDGQAFLVPAALGVRSALELDGARICVRDDADALDSLETFFTTHLMEHVVLVFRDDRTLFAAYEAGLCDAATAPRRRLAGARGRLADPGAHVILPELVAKDPLALVVADTDPAWADALRWIHVALLTAEAQALDQARAASDGADLGGALAEADAVVAAGLGILPGWARRAVAAVGHYGELFARHLGPATPMGLDRDLNALWRDGGLHYPLPPR
jgi:general L-amino acid transport system substrate-binding protein